MPQGPLFGKPGEVGMRTIKHFEQQIRSLLSEEPPSKIHSAFDGANAIVSAEGGGPVRFAGQLSKPAAITVGGVQARVDSRYRFEADVNLAPGPHTVTLVATDPATNTTVTHDYQVDVTAGTSHAYTRDENGNINRSTSGASSPGGKRPPSTTYEWDATDRLSAINTGTHRTEIQYDGLGRRAHITEKQSGSITSEKRFLWCGNELCEERNASGSTVTKRFFPQGEQRIGGTDAGTYFYTRDHLGSIREMTDWAGNARARYDYTPWGTRSKIGGDLDCDFGFTGFYFHSPSGLNFSRTRAHDVVAAKWLSRDPIGEDGGLNLYSYVFNQPTLLNDPLGLAVGDWWDARSYASVGGELNPFNLNSSFAQTSLSIADAMGGMLNGLAGNGWEDLTHAGDGSNGYYGLLEQTECDKAANYTAKGLLGLSGLAAISAGSVGLAEFAFYGNQPLAEFNILSNGNVFKVISRPFGRGFRIDPAHHGKPWGHTHWWSW
jgi:RHS repeat-associated protein